MQNLLQSNIFKGKDLTGPEKLKLLKSINMVQLFQNYEMLAKFKKYGHNLMKSSIK